MCKQIFGVAFRSVERISFVGIKPLCEVVAVNDAEHSLVHIEVETNINVFPGVKFGWVIRVWKFVSLQEVSLRDTGVLNLGLED